MSSKSKPTLSATPKNHEQLIQPHQPSAKKQSLGFLVLFIKNFIITQRIRF